MVLLVAGRPDNADLSNKSEGEMDGVKLNAGVLANISSEFRWERVGVQSVLRFWAFAGSLGGQRQSPHGHAMQGLRKQLEITEQALLKM